jgi:hypothetical protein
VDTRGHHRGHQLHALARGDLPFVAGRREDGGAVIEGARTLVKADGTRRTVRTLTPETAADLALLLRLRDEGLIVFGGPRAPRLRRRPRSARRSRLRSKARR